MAEPTSHPASWHPVEVDVDGLEEFLVEAQAVLETSDASATVRQILDAFVHLAHDPNISVRDVRAALSGVLARAQTNESSALAHAEMRIAGADENGIDDLAQARGYGIDRGVFRVPSDFDAPLSADVIASFEA